MDIHLQEQSKTDTAFRIQRVREAFAETRDHGQVSDNDQPVIEFTTFNSKSD
jgi:hypothetical protein